MNKQITETLVKANLAGLDPSVLATVMGKFCESCGRPLKILGYRIKGYNRESGEPTLEVDYGCPHSPFHADSCKGTFRLKHTDEGYHWCHESCHLCGIKYGGIAASGPYTLSGATLERHTHGPGI